MSQIKHVKGKAVVVRGHDIDTDRIIPARYLKEITFNRMGEFPFIDERFDADGNQTDHPFNQPHFQGAEILLVNRNFGCGSSREHAPQALSRWGIKAIVGESFGPIFIGNCVMMGIPTVMVSPEEMQELMGHVDADPDMEVTVHLEDRKVYHKDDRHMPLDIHDSHHNALTTGSWDSTSLLLGNMDKVKQTGAKLPYTDDFKAPVPL